MKADLEFTNELHTQSQYCLIEKLSESERRYWELVENLREIVFKCDERGLLTFLNQAWTETLGYSKAESMERSIGDFLHPEDREIALALIVLPCSKESVVSKELRFYHQNGEIVWLELSARHSSKEGLSGSLTDITERKRAQEALQQSEAREREKAQQLEQSLRQLQHAQAQLVHTEKMSSLGQLVAGVAHEINNPVNFIYGNLSHISQYIQDLLHLLQLYSRHYPHPVPEIQAEAEAIDLNFLLEDLPKTLSSMKAGTDRICNLVLGLRNFAHLDEAQMKFVDIHQGIDSTLLILQSRLHAKARHPSIQIIKEYGNLPPVECYPGQLNQVFMNILTNAIDALEEQGCRIGFHQEFFHLTDNLYKPALLGAGEQGSKGTSPIQNPQILIHTEVLESNQLMIRIADNGPGMNKEVCRRLFEPFFTTKPVGNGTGLGLSISYQIVVEKHGGYLDCISAPGQGAEFIIQIPIQQPNQEAA